MHSEPLLETRLDMPLVRRGKVRDVYDAGDDRLLIVATDRISAFDHVLGSGVPDKGRLLTRMSAFWFELLADIVPNHLLSMEPGDFPLEARQQAELLRDRAMLVRRTTPLPIECVARGYLSGSGWKDYQRDGAVCGVPLPPGLVESSQLPWPIFTPATKAESGHDENITEETAAQIVGAARLAQARDLTLALYSRAAAHARRAGIIIADTKFEFGRLRAFGASADQGHRPSGASADEGRLRPSGASAHQGHEELILIDEALTPDSSRFWPADTWAPGGPQPSYDKQFVRDHLEAIRWDKQPPVPALPPDVVARTREKYIDAYRRLTGRAWD